MVEIREETDTPNAGGDGPSTSSTRPSATSGNMTISQYISANTSDCVLNAARILTLVFSISYILPFLSPVAPDSAYYKAFAAAAATNALRVQQRVGGISFTREFLGRLMAEDSCHYLFYCILFITSAPVTMALLPISLFAALHAANFATKMMAATGRGGSDFAVRLGGILQQHTVNCLSIIACAEIFLIPLIISMIFVGRAALYVPFLYYRFLTFRYASQRNPYTRQAMAQMRFSLEQISSSPNCPGIVRTLITRSITFISSLAPAY